jgi:hypothetical protein
MEVGQGPNQGCSAKGKKRVSVGLYAAFRCVGETEHITKRITG